jgi:hypothetical protein
MFLPSPTSVLVLLSCLLTAAASGDDISLVRLILPSTLLGSESLPLDDPNTDFLETDYAQSVHPSPMGEDACLPPSWAVPISSILTRCSASLLTTFAVDQPVPPTKRDTPLRC